MHDQGKYGGFFGIGGTYESGIQDTYLLNCLIAAQVAGEDDFGLCVQTFEATDLKNKTTRDITSAAEVSLQIYTGLAMGADVFEYFAYNSNGDFNAIMNQDGSKRIYDIVKEGNEALSFSDVVNTFNWNGIVTSAGSANNHNGDAFASVEDQVLTNTANGILDSYCSTDDAVIGCFTKGDLNGYMVVNFNDPAAVTGNNTVTLTFADCTRARVYTNVDGVLTSEVVELTDGACTVTLVPGSLYSFNTAAMIMARDLFCQPYEIAVEGEYDTLVGCFAGNGEKAYMLVNYSDPIRKCTSTVTLTGNGVTQLRLYKDGKESVLQAQDGRFTVTLEPGNAAICLW